MGYHLLREEMVCERGGQPRHIPEMPDRPTGYVQFASRNNVLDYAPYMIVSYVNNKGLEEYWDYTAPGSGNKRDDICEYVYGEPGGGDPAVRDGERDAAGRR